MTRGGTLGSSWAAPDGRTFVSRKELREYLLSGGFLEFSQEPVGSVLVKRPGTVNGEAFALSHLRGCTVVLLDICGQVTAENLVDCRVFVGPCDGAVFVRQCCGCTFSLVSKQLRVLGSVDCCFYSKVASDPVVESSSGLIFAQFNAMSTKLETLEKAAGLSIDGAGKWDSVFDFNSDDNDSEGNFALAKPGQPLLDVRTKRVSPLGVCILRSVFWRFDEDRDGGLSYEEINEFQRAVGSEEVLSSTEALQAMFADVELQLDGAGNVSFHNFRELYELQGEEFLLSDLDKLGTDKRQLPVFDLDEVLLMSDSALIQGASDNGGEDSDGYGDEDFEAEDDQVLDSKPPPKAPSTKSFGGQNVDEEQVDEEQVDEGCRDVFATVIDLCCEARSRGVNLNWWFSKQPGDDARRSGKWSPPSVKSARLSRDAFETALAALLLSLVPGSSEAFQRDVEYIMKPVSIKELCKQLKDLDHPALINYMPLVLEANKLYSKRTSFGSRPATAMQQQQQHQSALQAADLETTVTSNAVQTGGDGLCVADYLEQLIQSTGSEHRKDVTSKICASIQVWKWSKGGRTPTLPNPAGGGSAADPSSAASVSSGKGSWSFRKDFVSESNLRYALRAALKVDFSPAAVHEFALLIQEQIESKSELAARLTQVRIESSSSRYQMQDARLDASGISHISAATGATGTDRLRGSQRLVTVAALMRWLGRVRAEKHLTREQWEQVKQDQTEANVKRELEDLARALSGDLGALAIFENPSNRSTLRRLLVAKKDFIPDWAVEGEAKRCAEAHLSDLQKSGASVRSRALHIQASQEDDGEEGQMSMMRATALAREELFEEYFSKVTSGLRADHPSASVRVPLFLSFAKGRRLGTIGVPDFSAWLRLRADERLQKQKTLDGWQRSKQNARRDAAAGEQQVCLARDLFEKVRALAHLSCTQQKDEKSGMMVCRSSRYEGLDCEKGIAQWVKMRSSKVSDAVAAQVAAGDVLISHAECVRYLGGTLTSLLADRRTRAEAAALLDPISAATSIVEESLTEKTTKSQISQLRAEAAAQVAKDTCFFTLDCPEEGELIVKEAKKKRREQADVEFKRWLKAKASKQRRMDKEKKAQVEASKAAEKAKKKLSKQEYKRWKKAATRNQYYTYAEGEEPGQVKRVLKTRVPMVDRGQVERIMTRPDWSAH